MRFGIAAMAWLACVGGVALFTARREAPRAGAAWAPRPAAGTFALEITAAFAVEPDPFALVTPEAPAAALLVRANGVEVLRRTAHVAAGEPVRVEPVAAVVAGRNEFYLEAHPPQDALNRAHAVRVRVLRDGAAVAERTLWSDPGTPVSGTFGLDVEGAAAPRGDRHEH